MSYQVKHGIRVVVVVVVVVVVAAMFQHHGPQAHWHIVVVIVFLWSSSPQQLTTSLIETASVGHPPTCLLAGMFDLLQAIIVSHHQFDPRGGKVGEQIVL
jgi:hypothetical protein